MPVSLMNRLHKTESSVFNLLMLYFKGFPFLSSKRSPLTWLCRDKAIQNIPVHRLSVGINIKFSDPFGMDLG